MPPFFFNDTATTEIYTLSLHDALPIYAGTLNLGGTFLTADLGVLSNTGGTTVLTGVLTNTASTLNLTGTTGSLALSGEIGRAHVWTPGTDPARMPASA